MIAGQEAADQSMTWHRSKLGTADCGRLHRGEQWIADQQMNTTGGKNAVKGEIPNGSRTGTAANTAVNGILVGCSLQIICS